MQENQSATWNAGYPHSNTAVFLYGYTKAPGTDRKGIYCGHLSYSLEEYQNAMLVFAEKSDGNEADRTSEGFEKMFGSYFPPEMQNLRQVVSDHQRKAHQILRRL